jgi:uncharacterized protein (TIGR03437 family)
MRIVQVIVLWAALAPALCTAATVTLQTIPTDLVPASVGAPNSTIATDGAGGVCINTGQTIRRFNPSLPGLVQVIDNASSNYALINPSPRFPDSLKAALLCTDGAANYLTYSSGSTALTLKAYGPSKPTFLKTGDALIGYNGPGEPNPNVNFGVFQDVFGLSSDFELGVGVYYYPADDPATLYQGIFRFTPGSLAPIALLARYKLSDGKKLVLESGNGLLWVSNLTDKTLTAYDFSGRAVIAQTGLVSESVVSAIQTSQQNISVVAYTTNSGLQVHRYSGPGQSVDETIVKDGQVNGHTLGPISSLAAVDHGFYAISQISPGLKALFSVLDGQYHEVLREDQPPTGQMLGVWSSPPELYMAQKASNGTTFTYRVFVQYIPRIDAILNGASFQAVTGLTRNTWMTIFGDGLALSTDGASSVPLPDNLGSTRVLIRIPAGQTSAPVLYASPTQINFLMPDLGTLVTSTSVAVLLTNGQVTPEVPLNIVPSSPGIFQIGSTPIVTEPNGRVLAPGEALQDGAVYVTYWNGLGRTSPMVPVNQLVPPSLFPLAQPARLNIGGGEAEVLFAGLTPQSVGLYQINFRHNLLSRGGAPYSAEATLTLSDGNSVTFPVTVQ